MTSFDPVLDIAVVGSGISGLAAAWLLSTRHRVTLFESAERLGGHTHTVDVPATGGGSVPVDTGFIVFNDATYPNLTALFRHLDVKTRPTEMTFAVSLDDGRLEYNGTDLGGVFAQRRNLVSPRFWSMLRDLKRFYATAPADIDGLGDMSLGAYLRREKYGAPFRDDHLLPMAAAIWSAPAAVLEDYPARAFIRFCDNHGLLKLTDRPVWRTVVGGSRSYIGRLMAEFRGTVALGRGIRTLRRDRHGVDVEDVSGAVARFDHVVLAAHADEALALLAAPSAAEAEVLGAFRYSRNEAVLHADPALMPRRRKAWASWNYLRARKAGEARLCVTYWMNALQGLPADTPLFVTLNPPTAPARVLRRDIYHHPIFDGPAGRAQAHLWSLQGTNRTWFCGAYFGAGFHEDGLQAGLAVAEALGGVRRPWNVAGESGRIVLPPPAAVAA